MAQAKLAVVAALVLVCVFGALFALTHSRPEIDAYLERSRSLTRVMFPLAVLLIAIGVVGLAAARAL